MKDTCKNGHVIAEVGRNKRGSCTQCVLDNARAYREKNTEKRRESLKAWRKANKEKVKLYNRKYYENNNDKCLARSKAQYEANKDKIKAYHKEFYKTNKDKILAKTKAWREANKDCQRKNVASLKNWYIAQLLQLPVSSIPPEVIEFSRSIIQLKREIRNATANSK